MAVCSAWIEARCAKNQVHAVVIDRRAGLTEERNGRHYVVGTSVRVTLADAEGQDMAVACAKFFDAVMAGSLRHTDQPQMNVSLSSAGKRAIGAGWAWNRRSAASDITPVTSATLALWGAQSKTVKHPGKTARASDRRAVVLS